MALPLHHAWPVNVWTSAAPVAFAPPDLGPAEFDAVRATLLFTDLVGSTALSDSGYQTVRAILNGHRVIGELARSHGLALKPLARPDAGGKSFFLSSLLRHLVIAEAPVTGTPLIGKRLTESRIRETTGLTVVGGAAMAFGIAVGAGSFHLLKELMLPPLPYADAGRIVSGTLGAAAGAFAAPWMLIPRFGLEQSLWIAAAIMPL